MHPCLAVVKSVSCAGLYQPSFFMSFFYQLWFNRNVTAKYSGLTVLTSFEAETFEFKIWALFFQEMGKVLEITKKKTMSTLEN